jgi:hypothetical protein
MELVSSEGVLYATPLNEQKDKQELQSPVVVDIEHLAKPA